MIGKTGLPSVDACGLPNKVNWSCVNKVYGELTLRVIYEYAKGPAPNLNGQDIVDKMVIIKRDGTKFDVQMTKQGEQILIDAFDKAFKNGDCQMLNIINKECKRTGIVISIRQDIYDKSSCNKLQIQKGQAARSSSKAKTIPPHILCHSHGE
jgi:hypothetical protein